ncbi:hypothetical protein [Paracraurococcus ruber]|uniref:hypothetical protein n=1 Tax=Paracraurococcus ruber TaxID=77675 RepID=UPI001305137E|nr:hypothetical protein [Paracraurococcus ruber]
MPEDDAAPKPPAIPRPPGKDALDLLSSQQGMIEDEWSGEPAPADKAAAGAAAAKPRPD